MTKAIQQLELYAKAKLGYIELKTITFWCQILMIKKDPWPDVRMSGLDTRFTAPMLFDLIPKILLMISLVAMFMEFRFTRFVAWILMILTTSNLSKPSSTAIKS